MYLNGDGIAGRDVRGRPITDDHFLLYFNAGEAVEVVVPPEEYCHAWVVVVDTTDTLRENLVAAGSALKLAERSTVVLRRERSSEETDDSVAASVAAMRSNG
jgi:glycogen operon protein